MGPGEFFNSDMFGAKFPEQNLSKCKKTFRINGCIVDYTDPSSVNSLSHYAIEVREQGLKYNHGS